jgi:RND family efflux transporter MFP subunit
LGRVAVIVVALVLLAGLGVWFWSQRARAIEVHTVTVRATVETTPGQKTVLNASGYVTPRREATVSSKVTGKVVEVLIEEGVRVKAGEVLARLDDTNTRANLDLANAQLKAATSSLGETEARLDEARKQHIRAVKLAANQISTQADLDKAEAEVSSLQARLQRQHVEVTVAERNVAVWQQQLDDVIIRAPFAGVIVAKNAQPGEMISPMSAGGFTRTGICTLVDMESLEIEVDVNESFINRVQPGQPVEATLDSYPDWKIPSKVIAIIPTADRQKATVRVRVGFEKLDPKILPQMGVKVAFRESDANGGASSGPKQIPKSALRREGDQDVVYVVQNARAERRALRLGLATENEVAVLAGLADGERVIISGPASLAEGVRVKETKQ